MFGGNFWKVRRLVDEKDRGQTWFVLSSNYPFLIPDPKFFHFLEIHQPCGEAEGEGEGGEEKQLPDHGEMQHRGSKGGNREENRQKDDATQPRQRGKRETDDAQCEQEL